jgi:Holliday junction resolvase
MDKVGAAKGMSDSQTRVVFAELFAAQVLGDAWVDEHLRSDEGATPEDHALFRYRLWRLGRLLFDLQSFDFYGDFVTNVKQRDLLGALFEAEVVRLLMQLPTRTVLRMPSGKKGLDYDIEFGGSDLNVAVEVKAKSEATPFTAKTVRYTLDDARGQLPKDGLGLIFLRVPYGWTTDQAYQTEIDGVVRALLRNTSRVQAVVLVWDVVANRSETTLRFEVRQRIFRRVHIDHGVEQMLTFLEEVWASEWDGLGPASAF